MSDKDKIELYMEKLGISAEEAQEVIDYDKAVDKMTMKELNATMSKEEKAIIKAMSKADRKPTVYKFDKKQKKENAVKADLIAQFAEFLADKAENVEVLNKEKLISFTIGDDKYELDLKMKRKPKN